MFLIVVFSFFNVIWLFWIFGGVIGILGKLVWELVVLNGFGLVVFFWWFWRVEFCCFCLLGGWNIRERDCFFVLDIIWFLLVMLLMLLLSERLFICLLSVNFFLLGIWVWVLMDCLEVVDCFFWVCIFLVWGCKEVEKFLFFFWLVGFLFFFVDCLFIVVVGWDFVVFLVFDGLKFMELGVWFDIGGWFLVFMVCEKLLVLVWWEVFGRVVGGCVDVVVVGWWVYDKLGLVLRFVVR